MTIGTLISTWLNCKYTGSDEFGNRYYVAKKQDAEGKYRRSVIYKGTAEASKVPPMWHSWLHYQTDELPPAAAKIYKWQKKHIPNLTGTDYAYRPAGHILHGEKRKDTTKYYESWEEN